VCDIFQRTLTLAESFEGVLIDLFSRSATFVGGFAEGWFKFE
jgi:hypothetical protein